MRTGHLLAAIVIAIGMGTAVAAPASADAQLDQMFLNALKNKGVPDKSDRWALDLAHSTCDLLNKGGTLKDGLKMLTTQTGWSVQTSADFGGLALYAYCKDKLPSGAGG
jgi:hypothetical protein